LNEFKRIAEGNKTSMGHIKREHLEKAFVLIPKLETYQIMDEKFEILIKRIIEIKLEIRKLSKLRDLLLSKMTKV